MAKLSQQARALKTLNEAFGESFCGREQLALRMLDEALAVCANCGVHQKAVEALMDYAERMAMLREKSRSTESPAWNLGSLMLFTMAFSERVKIDGDVMRKGRLDRMATKDGVEILRRYQRKRSKYSTLLVNPDAANMLFAEEATA